MEATAPTHFLSIGELGARYRQRALSPVAVVRQALDRIATLDRSLNSFIRVSADEAVAQAAAAERELAAGRDRGPLQGVSVAVKDLIDVAGVPTTYASRADSPRMPVADAALVRRLKEAGAVILGKTNLLEYAYGAVHPDFGQTNNPWDPKRTSGGSSGGSAAAVAAGLVPIAHAGDGGGSIRNPAGACGVVGRKPSRGRTSRGPELGEGWSGCVVEHVITRSVRDTAAVLDCVAGPANGDPYVAPPPARPFLAEVGRDPGELRIGFFAKSAWIAPHAEAEAAVASAARLLEALGHGVEDAHPAALDEREWASGAAAIVAASVARELAGFERATGDRVTPEDVEPATWAMAERGRALGAAEYLQVLDGLHAFGRRLRSFWRELPGEPGFDVLLTPTMAEPAPAIGSLRGAGVERILQLVPYTMPYNLSGQPAIGLPLHWSADGLPVGIQLVGAYGREDLLLRLASQLEQAQPWRDRRPPIHA
jgi:amidase